ncbi:hypothetical protein H2198_001378 [Neophaeococcomyces mojaviensis]|uniref:Uncharacterized protein n=1 Tax=Neophaeococcomyces mojaviensis TaxID=3383035 RepID=A0ACC3AHH7_9EURO|nr:hypothetical protein H2198_001378 [Knufia sp. JES_112]
MPVADDVSTASDAFNDTPSATSESPGVASALRWPCNIDQTVQGTVTNLLEETCIPAPHGVAHYVGPASSFEFANAIRQLVRQRHLLDDWRARQDRRSKLRAEFAHLKTSVALEPRIQAHPASSVREEGMESSRDPTLSAQHTPVQSHQRQDTDKVSNVRTGSPYRRWLQNLLPPKNNSDQFIQAFFEQVHPNYVLFHRGTFQTRYESIWQRSSTYSYEAEPGWLCSLFMVIVFGAQALEAGGFDDAVALQRRFLRFVRERFQHLALTASLANVQALLLLQLYEHNAGERNTAWILLGQASRMAIALGMHREGTSHNFDTIERNTRRMVWFTLYSFEQFSSLVLGRPSTIKALEVNVKLPDEAIIDGSDYPPKYLYHASLLMDLTSKVRHFATAASPNCFDEQMLLSLLGSANSLLTELKDWKTKLPKHLEPDWQFMTTRHQRAVLFLHMIYHHISSIIARPYLLCKVNHEIDSAGPVAISGLDPAITALSSECLKASAAVADNLHQLSASAILEGVLWTDFFYLYHAMLVLCLNFLSRRRHSPSSPSSEDVSYKAYVLSMIDLCQTTKLGPTFHILSQVAIQFAHIVGLAGDDGPSRDEEELLQHRTAPDTTLQTGSTLHSVDTTGSQPEPEQSEVFVPYAEPISEMYHFNNHDMLWDFFNIGGSQESDFPLDTDMQQLPTPFSMPFGNPSFMTNQRHEG